MKRYSFLFFVLCIFLFSCKNSLEDNCFTTKERHYDYKEEVPFTVEEILKNKPKNIPNPKGAVNPCTISGCQVILVLANANSGIIKKFTGFIKACSNLSKGDSTAVSFVGSVIATITPAIVACMPE